MWVGAEGVESGVRGLGFGVRGWGGAHVLQGLSGLGRGQEPLDRLPDLVEERGRFGRCFVLLRGEIVPDGRDRGPRGEASRGGPARIASRAANLVKV